MTEIVLSDLTTGLVNGEGIFDKLMAATKAHLEVEFNKNRIKGPEYSTVYLGALDNVLANAMQFLLQKAAIGLQADLLKQQVLLAEIAVTKAGAEVRLMESEILNSEVQRRVLEATVCKLQAEYDVLVLTKTKTTTENALLAQKVATEKAQIQALGVDDNSVIGKQKALYSAQTKGFDSDSKQKTAKILIDTWNARRMTDEGTSANTVNMLDDSSVGRAVKKILEDINA